MKVYIVTEGSYSDYHIEAVFTDKGQAELYCAVHEDTKIEEYEADEYRIEGKADDLKERWIYEVGLNIFGIKYKSLYPDGLTFDDVEEIEARRFPRPIITLTKTFEKNTDEEKIQKIMLDRYAQLEYEAQVERCGESLGL